MLEGFGGFRVPVDEPHDQIVVHERKKSFQIGYAGESHVLRIKIPPEDGLRRDVLELRSQRRECRAAVARNGGEQNVRVLRHSSG